MGKQFDPFAIEAPRQEYDEAKFYTQSTNEHDHSTNVQVKMKPAVYAEIQQIVAGGELPYSSPQAFIRDAIVHRLHWLNTNTDVEVDVHLLAVERHLAHLQQAEDVARSEDQVVQSITSMVNRAADNHDWRRLFDIIDMAEGMLEDLNDVAQAKLIPMMEQARRQAQAFRA